MKKRIGTKIYDTDKADLIETTADGKQIYRKTGRSQEIFLFDPEGQNKHEMFRDLSEEEAEKYRLPEDLSTNVYRSSAKVDFSKAEIARLKSLAYGQNLSIRQFLLMLVDEYERRMNI